MRLICPNCGAQYEVDPQVVPDTGRDVQCSNCGHTWFQTSPSADSELAQDMGLEISTDALEDDTEWVDHTPLASDDPVPEEPAPDDSFDQPSTFAEVSEPVDDPEPAPRSNLSDSVRDILRAEVEYDNAIRENAPLETQPDLGLEAAAAPEDKQALSDRMTRLRGLAPSGDSAEEPDTGKRRDLLPDIEEINSTLSSSSERDKDGSVPDDETRDERAQRSSFNITFLALIAIAFLLVAFYVFAPLLSVKVPALADALGTYVTWANNFRSWLNDSMSSASLRLNALLGQLNSGAE